MYSQELQTLINAALTDGVITESERRVIHKRAIAEGVDTDEIDMILDAEVHKLVKTNESTSKKVKKCPNCGEVIPTMAVRCEACGYEFQNLDANKTVEEFTKGLMRHDELSSLGVLFGKQSPKAEFIKSFALPNNAQDLYELIIYLSNAIKNCNSPDSYIIPAYKQKLKECQDKVKLLFPNDQRFVTLLQQTKVSWWAGLSMTTKTVIYLLFFALLYCFFFIVVYLLIALI